MPELIVGLVDGNGNLLVSQPYEEDQYGRRSREILVRTRGNRLVEILQDDLGNISYNANRLVLKQVLNANVNVSAMTLLGTKRRTARRRRKPCPNG